MLPSFYALANAWYLLLLVPLILFYFLKLRRPKIDLPSLALWRSVMNDQRVNSPFQKFKRNLLLLLQALALTLLVLAAMQPFIGSGPERAEYLPILIDCSASMAARDEQTGKTRLELAKEEARRLIDNMLPDQRLSFIAAHSTAQRLTEFTNNKPILYGMLDRLEVSDVHGSPEDALRMTQALARTVPIKRVIFFTDGNVPTQMSFDLPFELDYQQLPLAGPNIGITEFNARRGRGSSWDVFVRVEGVKTASTGGNVELLQDGEVVGQEVAALQPGESERLVFRIETESESKLEARVRSDGFDSLPSDNVAYLELAEVRPLVAYVPTELTTYRHAMAADKEITLVPDETGADNQLEYDMLISDQEGDLDRTATVSLFTGVVPEDLKPLVTINTGLAEVVDWDRNAPLLQHVQLTDVQISDEPQLAAGATDQSFEELGYEILAHGRTAPLIVRKRAGDRIEHYMFFHTNRSTLPYRIGFPIMLTNLVQSAMQEAGISESRAVATSTLPPRMLQPDREYHVRGPDGATLVVRSNDQGEVSGVPADSVGHYAILDGGEEVASIGASLVDSQETSLATVEALQFTEVAVAASDSLIRTDQPLWAIIAVLAFVLLLVEWWYFQRPPRGVVR